MGVETGLFRSVVLSTLAKPTIDFVIPETVPVKVGEAKLAFKLSLQKKYKTSSIIISHDMSCVKFTADRVVLLLDGRCYIEDSFEHLEQSQDEHIKQFFI